MTELFSVHSLVRGFAYEGTRYEEVKVTWFVVERPTNSTKRNGSSLKNTSTSSSAARRPRR
jgi:hypothetical protein